jgi:hypothetical protein
MAMYRAAFFICLTIFKICMSAQNFSALYSFANVSTSSGSVDPTAPPGVAGLTLSAFLAHSVSANPNAAGRFSFTSWPLGGIHAVDGYSNFTGSLDSQVYFEFKISPATGFTFDLTGISFGFRRSSTGIRNFALRCSRNNFSRNLRGFVAGNPKIDVIGDTIFFWKYDSVSISTDQKGCGLQLDSTFKKMTDTITFRIYAWNAEAKSGSFSLDNVTVTGSAYDSILPPDTEGIAETEWQSRCLVFPNPVEGDFLDVRAPERIISCEIFDAGGQLVFRSCNEAGMQMRIDTGILKDSFYFLRVNCTDNFFCQSFLLQNHN